jgi:hypothetical protein
MKILISVGLICFAMISCERNKEIQLPKANFSVVTQLLDHSPIYLFFDQKGKDTLAVLNRKNAISSTHWIFSIDKRLPLRLVIPQVQFLQTKKEASAHKSETAENYFAYANDSLKTLAFTPFTKLIYKQGKAPKTAVNVVISVTKNGSFIYEDKPITLPEIKLLGQAKGAQYQSIQLQFDDAMLFGTYLQAKILVEKTVPMFLAKTEYID